MLEEYGRLLHEAELQQQLKSRKQRPKKFRCPHCQVAFSNNGQLKGHVRIHTGGSIAPQIVCAQCLQENSGTVPSCIGLGHIPSNSLFNHQFIAPRYMSQ